MLPGMKSSSQWRYFRFSASGVHAGRLSVVTGVRYQVIKMTNCNAARDEKFVTMTIFSFQRQWCARWPPLCCDRCAIPSYQNDKLQCCQGWKVRHNDDIFVSAPVVCTLAASLLWPVCDTKLSKWQIAMLPGMKSSSQWRYFRFSASGVHAGRRSERPKVSLKLEGHRFQTARFQLMKQFANDCHLPKCPCR